MSAITRRSFFGLAAAAPIAAPVLVKAAMDRSMYVSGEFIEGLAGEFSFGADLKGFIGDELHEYDSGILSIDDVYRAEWYLKNKYAEDQRSPFDGALDRSERCSDGGAVIEDGVDFWDGIHGAVP